MHLQLRAATDAVSSSHPSLTLNKDGRDILISVVVFAVLASISVALRFYVRSLRKVPIALDDWLILGSLITLIAVVPLTTLDLFIGGIGYHSKSLDRWYVENSLKFLLVMQILFPLGVGLAKLSLCIVILRIFGVRSRMQVAAYILMVCSVCWVIMALLISFLICRPLSHNWDPFTAKGSCGNQTAAYAAMGVVDIIVDIGIMVLPLPAVFSLQMPLANKFGVAALLLLGILTISITAVRVVIMLKVDWTDFSYSAKGVFIWSACELAVAIIVSCSSMLRPVFDKIFGLVKGGASDHTNPQSKLRVGKEVAKVSHAGGTFNRLDESEVALTEMTLTGKEHENYVVSEVRGGRDGDSSREPSEGSFEEANRAWGMGKGISVQRQWTVHLS
ncbi:MAG: hypothetical protein M1818_005749 [Claussenomyces sp. TS43310]|nr:MAG: hypothetical protein M1818_005749 [Claussenomyces sp. TS43310]